MKNSFKNIFAVICSAGVAVAFCACTDNGMEHQHEYSTDWSHDSVYHWHTATCGHDVYANRATHSFSNGECICGYSQPKSSITFDEFIENHSDKAVRLLDGFIKDEIYGEKEVLSENWKINANEDDELSEVNVVYTYKDDETNRTTKYQKVVLNSPIDLDDIVDGNAVINKSEVSISTLYEFSFDAKENSKKRDVAEALYNAVEMQTEKLKLFNLVDYSNDYKEYTLFKQNATVDGKASLTTETLRVRVADDSDEALINSLSNPSLVGYRENTPTIFDGANIKSTPYTLEQFKDDPTIDPDKPNPPEKEDKIGSIENLLENYSEEVEQALNENYYDEVVNKTIKNSIPRFDESKLSIGNWDFECDENNNITKVNLLSYYDTANNMKTLFVSSITLKTPISLSEMTEENISELFENSATNADYKVEYLLSYETDIQETRVELRNAIFDALGVEDTGATRFIVDQGGSIVDPKFGDARLFKVVEISNNKIEQYEISIASSTSDEGLIRNLLQNGIYMYNNNSYDLGGYTLNQEKEKESERIASNERYVIYFDEDEIDM